MIEMGFPRVKLVIAFVPDPPFPPPPVPVVNVPVGIPARDLHSGFDFFTTRVMTLLAGNAVTGCR